MKKYKIISVLFIFSLLFFSAQTIFAAPLSLIQVDVGSLDVSIPMQEAYGDGGRTVLANGDAVFYGYSIIDDYNYYQILYYNHTTGRTNPVSVSSTGEVGNSDSYAPSVSSNGRYVVFESDASNLVANDTNGIQDIFLRDTQLNTTTRISVDSNGAEGNGYSYSPSISSDGRYIAFSSDSTNLVASDTNGMSDIFLHDTQLNTTTRISVGTNGAEGNHNSYSPSISSDGRYIAFQSDSSNLVAGDTNESTDVFLRDTQLNTTTHISIDTNGTEGNGYSYSPSISSDGRYIAFQSDSSNLVSNDTNGSTDIFLRDTQLNTTTRISVDTNGTEGNDNSYSPSISSDGRYIAFDSGSTNLVTDDTNRTFDVFFYDTQLNTTTRISVDTNGAEGNDSSYSPSISSDGRYIAFDSDASNLISNDTNESTDVFLRDTQLNTITKISNNFTTQSFNSYTDNNNSYNKNISSDGRYIAFESEAINLVADDTNASTDIFLRDTQLNTTTRISVDSNGAEGDSSSYSPSVSSNGRYVVFESDASNLVANDTNGIQDIFLRDTQLNTTTRISVDSNGAEGNGYSYSPSISSDGRYIAFDSYSSNLVAGDTNETSDVFLRDTQLNTTTRVSVATSGTEGDSSSYSPSISSDGRYIAFESEAINLVADDTNVTTDIFLRDIQLNTTTRISVGTNGAEGDDNSYSPSISSDGRYIAFSSDSTNLVASDTNGMSDIFLHDTQLNTTTRISVDSNGAEGNGYSYSPSISSDGRYIAFESNSSNLVADDTNVLFDIFLRDTQLNTTTRISVDANGTEGNNTSDYASISPDGSYIAFTSYATNLLPNTGNGNYFLAKVKESTPVPDPTCTDGIKNQDETGIDTGGVCAPEPTPVAHHTSSGSSASNRYQNLLDMGNTGAAEALKQEFPTQIQATTTPTTVTTPTSSIQRTLKYKMKGDDVKSLQTYLNEHNYNCGIADGKFGKLTKQAVVKFQKANNLVPDGIVGSKTREVMK